MGMSTREASVTAEELLDYDIVLISYDILTKEVHFAQELPDRQLRISTLQNRDLKPKRSPLVEISWWRV